jgi:PPM family protein phosphatase
VLRVTAMTHRGAVRPSNEDSLVVGAFTACGVDMAAPVTWTVPLSGPVVVAVADGMGGHAAGEIASAHTVRSLATSAPDRAERLDEVLRQVDTELLALSREHQEIAGLGTTVVGVLIDPESSVVFNIGDSRLYLETEGRMSQLSVDDRAFSGALTQCLGGGVEAGAAEPRIEALEDTGRLLLCSDGLSDLVDPPEMARMLADAETPEEAVTALWAAAMDVSGRDNITIALLQR